MTHTKKENSLWLGKAKLQPDPSIMAGEVGTWEIIYTVGRFGIDDGGQIKVAMRLASDWAPPQVDKPSAPDYLSVRTDGNARVSADFVRKGHIRPWFRTVIIQVNDGSLQEGDQILIVYGDKTFGGPGTRAQTFRENGFEFRVFVDPFGAGVYVRIPESPKVDIVGGNVHKLVVLAPSQVLAGEPFWVVVKAEDSWGNPSDSFTGNVTFKQDRDLLGLPESYTFGLMEKGVHRFNGVSLKQAGFYGIGIFDHGKGLEAHSNPIQCLDEKPTFGLYWADLHGQTGSTVGTGTVEEYYQFARDVAAMDACSHQGNDFQITGEAWREIVEETKRFHQPGEFITFLGYEWSGNSPAGGDHNVLWFDDDQPLYRSSHWQIEDKSDENSDQYPISDLYQTLKGKKALLIPHIGGRAASLDFHDPDLEPLIEICSVHGRFEWFLREALERGLKVGVVANGDDHTGRPGASYGSSNLFGLRGGLTCILAKSLTREGIWEALKARRTYATTGERIVLSVKSEGHTIGEFFRTSRKPQLEIEVFGTAPLFSVEIMKGPKLIHVHPLFNPEEYPQNRLRLAWSGAKSKGRNRNTLWDGTLRIDGGRFVSIREFAFDKSQQGIQSRSEKVVSWKSTTCGDMDGLVIEIEPSSEPRFTFDTEPISFTFTLDDLKAGPVVQHAGGIDQKVEVSFLPKNPGPLNTCFFLKDARPDFGINPYYVRVTQEDGEMAWSSPLFIEYHM